MGRLRVHTTLYLFVFVWLSKFALIECASVSILREDAGDTFETATEIPFGDFFIHEFVPDNDVDFFKSNLIEGQETTIVYFRTFAVFDRVFQGSFGLSVRDENGSFVSTSSSSTEDTYTRVKLTPTYSGPHVVNMASIISGGEYTIGFVAGDSPVLPNLDLPSLALIQPFPITQFPGAVQVFQTSPLRFSYVPAVTGILLLAVFEETTESIRGLISKPSGEFVSDHAFSGGRATLSIPIVAGEEVIINMELRASSAVVFATTNPLLNTTQGGEDDDGPGEIDLALTAGVGAISGLLVVSAAANVAMYKRGRRRTGIVDTVKQ